ncbi:hypothetical protein bcgnr5386_54220 [Bacillus cereus]
MNHKLIFSLFRLYSFLSFYFLFIDDADEIPYHLYIYIKQEKEGKIMAKKEYKRPTVKSGKAPSLQCN